MYRYPITHYLFCNAYGVINFFPSVYENPCNEKDGDGTKTRYLKFEINEIPTQHSIPTFHSEIDSQFKITTLDTKHLTLRQQFKLFNLPNLTLNLN